MNAFWAQKGKRKAYSGRATYGRASGNPFFNRPKPKSRYSPKTKIIFWSSILLIISFGWLLFFSKYFLITGVLVNGEPAEIKSAIEDKIWQQTKKHRWLIFRQSNLFMFDKNSLSGGLKNDYIFDQLSISKKLFHKIKIDFHEKDFSFVWKEGDKYYFIDEGGAILKEADPLSITPESFPMIDNQGQEKAAEKKISDNLERINYIRALYDSLKSNKDLDLKIEKFVLDDDPRTVKLQVSSGPQIFFNTEPAAAGQLNRLSILIKEKLKNEYLKKKYIDLRFGELIYYQ